MTELHSNTDCHTVMPHIPTGIECQKSQMTRRCLESLGGSTGEL